MLLTLKQIKKVHFIGISGIGMSGVALLSHKDGIEVTGSADEENEQTRYLQALGIKFFLGHRAENVGNVELVVRSAAVFDNNPEVKEAKKRGIPVYFYSEYLGKLMQKKKGIAISGSHGKTTTTAMLTSILYKAGLDPASVCGGVMEEFGANALYGKGSYFVAEACEYHRSFLDLHKWYGIITNIEPDHLDYYHDLEDIKYAFLEFLKKTDGRGFFVVNGDDPSINEIIAECDFIPVFTVGYHEKCVYKITDVIEKKGYYSCFVNKGAKDIFQLKLSLPGRFNLLNAALSGVTAHLLGVERGTIETALSGFKGTKRRLEKISTRNEFIIYSDYAHHPTEIESTIKALRELHRGKEILVIFQPHQFSRTIRLFDGFVKSLQNADLLVLTDIYWQRDNPKYVKAIESNALYLELKKYMDQRVYYFGSKEEIFEFINKIKLKGKVIIFMGAGSIDFILREYLNKIS